MTFHAFLGQKINPLQPLKQKSNPKQTLNERIGGIDCREQQSPSTFQPMWKTAKALNKPSEHSICIG
jgi:hypothetical protein